MAKHVTPWNIYILDILRDNQWHTRDEIVERAGPSIPAGRAYRQVEQDRKRYRKDEQPPPERQRNTDMMFLVTSGRRRIVTDGLNSLKRQGYVVQRKVDGVDQFKANLCPTCFHPLASGGTGYLINELREKVGIQAVPDAIDETEALLTDVKDRLRTLAKGTAKDQRFAMTFLSMLDLFVTLYSDTAREP